MTKWEYKIDRTTRYSPTSAEQELNRMGLEGWELVSIRLLDNGDTWFWLKRPLE